MTKTKKSVSTRTEVFDDFLDKPSETSNPKELKQKLIKSEVAATDDWFELDDKKPRRVAMTFTLDPTVASLIENAAHKHRVSRSRIIEKIAAKTLGTI